MGRKPAYDYTDPMFLLEMEGYSRDGLDNKQIAENLGLSESQFSRIVNKYDQLAQSLKRGRRPLNTIVEGSLFKRATGMKVKTTTKKWMILPDGTQSDVEIILEVETELPPDTGAAMAWLKHRKPEVWNKAPTKVASTDPEGDNAAPLLFLSAESFTEEQIQDYIKKNIGYETGDNNESS